MCGSGIFTKLVTFKVQVLGEVFEKFGSLANT